MLNECFVVETDLETLLTQMTFTISQELSRLFIFIDRTTIVQSSGVWCDKNTVYIVYTGLSVLLNEHKIIHLKGQDDLIQLKISTFISLSHQF